MTDKLKGYVYILEVADIELPVCKIGMTTRDPVSRCHEINKSSTGDFIWSVAFSLAVDDCQSLEKLIHHKLTPLRQKRREFFNISPENAWKAVISIFYSQSDIKIVDKFDEIEITPEMNTHSKTKKSTSHTTRQDAAGYTALLQTFCEVLEVKGRPFGQLNKPFFGMSDGNEGVQWNISVHPQCNTIHMGVNLEGKMYKNWPVSQLIQSELIAPELPSLIAKTDHSDDIFLTFWRDAWQVASRPEIKEKYIGGRPFRLNELTGEKWQGILSEAQECLDKKAGYQKRNTQNVTIVKKDGTTHCRTMQVSPHLTVWSPLFIHDSIEQAVRDKITELTGIYSWMKKLA